MSQEHPHQIDKASIQPEGEDKPSVLDGISKIRTTLDELEAQIAEYRKLLAEEEAITARRGAEPSVVEVVDETRLGNIAEEIAADAAALYDPRFERDIVATQQVVVEIAPTAIEDAKQDEKAGEERKHLAEPKVELLTLFAELQMQLEMGLHRNASVAVFVDGEELLSYLSSEDGSGATPELPPLFRAFSSGKAMAAATIWRLLDAGNLEIDAPVARYWPEFAQRGKTGVTLRHVLTHTAGLPRDFGRGDVDWGDWGRMIDILASMPLEYEPGKIIHYHAITFGLLVAEIASRATGDTFVDLFEREVKSPLGLSDTSFAVDLEDREARRRIQRLHVPADYHDQDMPRKMDWLLDNQIVSPGATCVTSARDLTKLYSAVCGGGQIIEDEVWLSEEAAENVYTVHARAYDIESMLPLRIGQGVWFFDDQPNRMAAPVESRTFGHGGMGTSIAWGDPDHDVAVAIVADTMQMEELNGKRLNRISAAVRRDLELPAGDVEEF
ncbi:MAG: beta-lactamase family protein [Chloroflexi bacterium]|nr:beta-lactamase family protein [Chloroflexota bacterium]MYF78732.1 beta-lactamase family protein [Chloroflexota bacterium]MYK62058.1 beta-lactamase family protein [Chloroflexota bacterium]